MNLGALFTHHASFRPRHTALVFQDKRLTYRELNADLNRLVAAFTRLGLQKGDNIATLLPNCLELYEIYWACAKMGAAVVPLSTLLLEKALVTLLNDSDSKALVTKASFGPQINAIKGQLPGISPACYLVTDGENLPGWTGLAGLMAGASPEEPPAADIGPDDIFNIMYSSGTTGLPKGIIHTHYVRAMYALTQAAAYRLTPESVVLHSGSIVFNGAFVTLMPCVFLGATYVLLPMFDVDGFIDAVKREKATHVMLVPSQIVALLHSPHFNEANVGSLEMLLSLGAPLHREHKEELSRRLPGRFYELYGLTEGFVTILDKNDFTRKPDSVGCPPPFFEMRILNPQGRDCAPGEVGEICGRGPILMPGYYKRPDLTAQAIVDGWLHSGDLGRVDEDGFLYLVDRQKDMIISGGVNVYPRDIEEIVVQHPEVREAAVFDIPSEKWGETPVAAVILRQPGAVTAAELKDWINQRVAAKFQRVSEVRLREDFPRGVAGKTLKRVMREEWPIATEI